MIEAFEIGVALALETGDAQAALSGLAVQLSTLDQQMTDVQSRISQTRAGNSNLVMPEKLPAFEDAPRRDSSAALNLLPDAASIQAKRPLQSEAGSGDLVQPPLMAWFQRPSQRAEADAVAQAPAHDSVVSNDGPGRTTSELPLASKPEAPPLAPLPKLDVSDTGAYWINQIALSDVFGIMTKAAAREADNLTQPQVAPSTLELTPPRLQSFGVLPTQAAATVTRGAADDASQAIPPLAAKPERASVLGGFGDAAFTPLYELLQRARNNTPEVQKLAEYEARSAPQVYPTEPIGDGDARYVSGSPAPEGGWVAQEPARGGIVMPAASDLAPEWQMAHPADSAMAQVSPEILRAAISLPPSLAPAGRLPTEANFDFGSLAPRQFGAVPVPPAFSQPENLSANRAGQDQDSQTKGTNSNSSQQEDREAQRDNPIVIHTNVHVDGDVVARAVTDRIFAALNGPLTGTGGFDSRRSYTPVES